MQKAIGNIEEDKTSKKTELMLPAFSVEVTSQDMHVG